MPLPCIIFRFLVILCKNIMLNNLGASWIDEEFYGFTQPVSPEVVRNYFKALFVVAVRESMVGCPLPPLLQNRACDFHRTRLLSNIILVMDTVF